MKIEQKGIIVQAKRRLQPKFGPLKSRVNFYLGAHMRFIFNFIFFGILFYLISVYFPEPFHTLVSWADSIVSFVKELFHMLMERISSSGAPPALPPPTP